MNHPGVPLQFLKRAARLRGEMESDYMADALAMSIEDGNCRVFTPEAWLELRHKYPEGFGDSVERIAKPIAKLIDEVFGTDLENCQGCDGRREFLNTVLPFK